MCMQLELVTFLLIIIRTYSITKLGVELKRVFDRHGGSSNQRECDREISVFCSLHVGDDLHHALADRRAGEACRAFACRHVRDPFERAQRMVWTDDSQGPTKPRYGG